MRGYQRSPALTSIPDIPSRILGNTNASSAQAIMLRLKIQAQTSIKTIEVDSSTRVGTFLLSFVKKLGYPPTDGRGTPLSYHLRLATGEKKSLPHGLSFAELQIPSGSLLVLNVPETKTKVTPLKKRASLPTTHTRPSGRLNRRTFLLASIYTAVSGSGLLLGATTEIIQRTTYAAHGQTQTTPQQGSTTPPPIKAVKQLTFTQHRGVVRTLAWSGNGSAIASGSDDSTALIWTPDGSVLRQLPHQAPVRAIAWAPDGQRIAVGSANQVSFWQASAGMLQAQFNRAHTGLITSLSWTSRGDMQVVSGSRDMRAIVWNTANANYQVQTIFAMHTTPIEASTFDSTGQIIATASEGGLVRVWRAASGQETHGYYQPAQVPVRAIAFSPSQPLLAMSGDNGQVQVWQNGVICTQQTQGTFGTQCIDTPQILRAHTKPVRAVAWSPSGGLLATGGEDGHLAIWSMEQGTDPLIAIHLPDTIQAISWGPTDGILAAASGNSVTIWALRHIPPG